MNTASLSSYPVTPKQWAVRWANSIAAPLYSLRMRTEIDLEMRDFSRRLPKHHAVFMAGLLHDVVSSLGPVDPIRNLYKDKRGVVRLPGKTFGSRRFGIALPLPYVDFADALSPMADPISGNSVEFVYRASQSWQLGRDYLLELVRESEERELPCRVHGIAEESLRWALSRREAYALDGDPFFALTALAWIDRIL